MEDQGMINKPPVDPLAKKIGSRYALCVVVAKRARQLIEIAASKGEETVGDYKAITAAAMEVMEGKLTATND